jgi:DNA-binding CsgD family transcriptional regulator
MVNGNMSLGAVVQDADIVAKSSNLTQREKEIALLKYDPEAFVHRNV